MCILCSTEHENDKATWAAEKQAFEEHVQQLKDEGEGLRSDLKAKGIALEELEQAKQKMMEDYEQTIAQQTEAFEARISSLETERDELQQYKVTFQNVSTCIFARLFALHQAPADGLE